MPLCWTCLRQAKARLGPKTIVGGVFDDVPGPYRLGKEIGSEAPSVPGPYGLGQSVGNQVAEAGPASALGKGADAAKEIASTIKTLAVVGGLFGAAIFGYSLYRAHKAQAHVAAFAAEHPEVMRAALLA